MLKAKKQWQLQEIDESKVKRITTDSDIHPLTARILSLRGVNDREEALDFLSIKETSLHDPYLFKDMKKVVERIQLAIIKNEKILIYGDYDADGVTSTALLHRVLNTLGASTSFHIPNRFTEGYGLNKEAIEKAANDDVKVILTVDTGISAINEAKLADELGITLIITDHHEPQEELPSAYAIIDPKTPDETYPFRHLAGVGVAFKLTHALLARFPKEYLDIVALGTIADLVPLIGENRVIASLGLKEMSRTQNVGLKTLLMKNGLQDKEVTSENVGFILAPRINVAGRLESPDIPLELLITEDFAEAEKLATKINKMNLERQALVRKVTEEAIEIINSHNLDKKKVIIVAKEGWNTGIIGIVASKILDKYHKPTIILSIDSESEVAKGSSRSIEAFDIFKALSKVKDILITFGGHTAAAGLSISKDNIELLQEELDKQADELLTDSDFVTIEKVDSICNLQEINLELIKELNRLEPFGIANPKPKVLVNNIEVAKVLTMGAEKKHLKLNLRNKNRNIDAVYFNNGDLHKHIANFSEIEVVTELNINEWNGNTSPQLLVRDLRLPEQQIFDWRSVGIDELSTNSLITDDKVALFYDGEHEEEISNKFNNNKVIDYYDWKNIEKYDITTIVLIHLPPSLNILQELLEGVSSSIERIYCLFGCGGYNNKGFNLDRELCKKIYIELLRNEELKSIKNTELYFSRQGVDKSLINTILLIFGELDFIKIVGENFSINHDSEKKDLSTSKIYNEYILQQQINKILLRSSHKELIEWFLKNMK